MKEARLPTGRGLFGRLVCAALLTVLGASVAACRESRGAGDRKTRHRFIVCCFSKRKVVIVDKDGKFERVIEKAGNVQDAWMLRDGNILYSHYGGARVVDPRGKIIWEYKTDKPKETQVHSAQPLSNGNVLIGESGRSRLVEVDRRGKVVKEIKIKTQTKHKHREFRTCRKTLRGTYLVACFGDGVFREVDGNGRVLRELIPGARPQKGGAHAVVPLPNGHVLASTGYAKSFVEFDRNGKVVWTLSQKDLPEGFKLAYACSAQRLPNGNTVVATYHGDPQFLEVTRDKKVVWSYNHQELGNASGIVLLDVKGDPAKGEILR